MKDLPIRLGPLALLLTVISICMTVFGILTYATARADMNLAETYAETHAETDAEADAETDAEADAAPDQSAADSGACNIEVLQLRLFLLCRLGRVGKHSKGNVRHGDSLYLRQQCRHFPV